MALSNERLINNTTDSCKVLCGGPPPTSTVQEESAEVPEKKVHHPPSFDDGKEPVNWHGMSMAYYEDFLKGLGSNGVFNATCLDVELAKVCLRLKIPFVGVVMTDFHRDAAKAELKRFLFKEYQDETGPLYQPALAELITPAKKSTPKKAATKKKSKKKAEDGADGEPKDDDDDEEAKPDGGAETAPGKRKRVATAGCIFFSPLLAKKRVAHQPTPALDITFCFGTVIISGFFFIGVPW